MPYAAINNTEIDTDSPITGSLMARMRDNPKAIAEHDDSATAAPRVHCDAAAGDASALASTAAVGKVLRVSATASPDGHGNLVEPQDLASAPPSVLHHHLSSSGPTTVSVVLTAGKRYMLHCHAQNDLIPYSGFAYFDGSSIVFQSCTDYTVNGTIFTNKFTLSGTTVSIVSNPSTGTITASASIIAHEVAGLV